MSVELSAHGVGIVVPRGWEVEIATAPDDGSPAGRRPGASPVVAHMANFALPVSRGDFGGGAVELMGRSGVFVALCEYDAEATGTALFRHHGVPRRLRVGDFSPDTMQRTLPDQSGHQSFGSEAGRAWCLYAVLGSHRRRELLVRLVNEVLAGLTIGTR